MNISSYLDLVKVQSKVTNSEIIESCKIKENNGLSKFHENLNQFYKLNGLMYHERKFDNPNIHQSIVTNLINTRRTIFEMNYKSNKERKYFENSMTVKDHFFNSTFAGLKTYKQHTDNVRTKILNKYIDMHKTYDLEYGITELHLAFDIIVNSSIDNFIPIKLVKSVNICNPLDKEFESTIYIESTKDPKLKAYLYCKVTKEKLNVEKNIYRFEIRFRDMHDISRNPYKIIDYIQENLQSYKLFYFDDIQLCNQFKKEYSNNIRKVSSPNVPEKLLRELKKHGTEIELILSNEIKQEIISMLIKHNEKEEYKILKSKTICRINQINYFWSNTLMYNLNKEFLQKVYQPTINSPP